MLVTRFPLILTFFLAACDGDLKPTCLSELEKGLWRWQVRERCGEPGHVEGDNINGETREYWHYGLMGTHMIVFKDGMVSGWVWKNTTKMMGTKRCI